MIVCPDCKQKNPEGSKVCQACGAPLENYEYRACPSCGALNPAQNVFCHRCLSELSAPTGEEGVLADVESPVGPSEESVSLEEAELVPPHIVEERPGAEGIAAEQVELPMAETPVRPKPAEEDQDLLVKVEPSQEPDLAEATGGPPEPDVAASLEGQLELEAAIEAEDEKPDEVPLSQGDAPELERVWPTTESAIVPKVEETEEEGPRETLPDIVASPLDGLDGLLPLETAVSLPHRATPPTPEVPSEAEQADADLFQQIADQPAPLAEQARTVVPHKVRLVSRAERVVLYLLVLLAALTPLFSGGQIAPWVHPRASVSSLADVISGLPDYSTVLVSFDYSPAYAGEMNPLALAVVRHLATHSVHLVAMSIKPEGVGLAEQIFREIADEMPSYRYGEEYAILGFLPGQEAGLRTLNNSLGDAFKIDHVEQRALSDLPVTRGLDTPEDFDQVIVLAEDSQLIRYWIEQVQSTSYVPLHALVSARIEPMLIPYLQSGQLRSLIAGAYGAAQYEMASNNQASVSSSADSFAALFFVLLLAAIVTNVVYIGKGQSKRPGK